ncbi:MetQ/NlpA family ABC transporter substrate-binding protein [Convivina praedatoris]|uniref:Lipoprotein n=1 Tax=Convivina praedatoris TaxID=2880963 RepID=A0ABN8HCK9_9LACO|nr:MetQ/NlpA family ABC transporter substrate-binding protein [Convivina sp. LMG 32447]CAH1852500.1 D-methionine-binding lipoprotein MetQ [Convivina sp. LMG 32447]CAH1852535.1 D-methionine-binding lipoprotein MetQ [Convivina sp. LMG 32447]CAH1855051.1 D-methionine-binding lipoprotein MetQ [Convivina sp. LMG 32447]
MSKKSKIITSLIVICIGIAAYFSFFNHPQDVNKTVKIGVMAGDQSEDEIWDNAIKTAKEKYGITLKTVKFNDYSQPNKALANHDIDLNAFQNYPFLENWNKANKSDIVSIGDTWTTPLRLYSSNYKNISDFNNGDQIAVANDVTNENRGLHLLAEAGLIKLKDTNKATTQDITENPKNLKITAVDASQTAKSLKDPQFAGAVINTNFAKSAKIDFNSAIYVEGLNKNTTQFFNFIAANKKDENNQTYKNVVKSIQTAKTKELVEKNYHGAEVTVWDYKK